MSLQQKTGLRCSVALALVADRQRAGETPGNADGAYPDTGPRAREFFVRNLAGLMEDERYTREWIVLAIEREREELAQPGALDAVMPTCLMLLDASGL